MTLGFHKTRTINSLRVWFPLVRNGLLVPSASSSDFTTYVIDSNDAGFISPSVFESTQRSGIYYFDISSSFFLASGTGDYNISIEVDKLTPPKVNDVYYGHINVTTDDIDSISARISEGISLTSNSIAEISASVWNALESNHDISGTMGFLQSLLNDINVFTSNSFSIINTNLDTTISSRAAPGDQMDLLQDTISFISSSIWNALSSNHGVSGTFGWFVDQIFGIVSSSGVSISSSSINNIIDGIWDEPLSEHVNSGTSGWSLGLIDDVIIIDNEGVIIASSSVDTIVDAIWDELINEHNISGSTARILATAGAGGVDTNLLADAVWSRDAALNNVSGTMGWLQNKIFPMSSSLSKVRAMTCGRWIISGSQMIFYDEDNTTEVARFDLFDTEGDAFFSEPNAPAERVVI